MKHTKSIKSVTQRGGDFKGVRGFVQHATALNPLRSASPLLAPLCLLFHRGVVGSARAVTTPGGNQNRLIPIGVLSLVDESGLNAPPDFGQKAAQELRGKLITAHKDVLPRFINNSAPAAGGTLTVDELTAIGKQNGVKFIIRGGLLSAVSESAGGETST